MTELQKRILDYIAANQPVTEAQGKKAMGISRNAYRVEIRQMANLGMICIKNGSGAFRDEASYQEWLDRIGSKMRAHRIISAREKCKKESRKWDVRKPKSAVSPVEGCKRSDAHRRMMMVYGRAGV
ncbi:hypothetical protein [Pluralibacter gergoviae]|uniref:hypothetical protein n=1 Tax=Pluralibacter gergoviae TaxID=61647 RepID=UPI00069F7FEF|nr:hypothetical protein [Pluralibacter gergoviae]